MAAWRFLTILACFVLYCHVESEAHVLQKRAIVKCETVLSPKLCQTYRDIAKNLKLTANVIDDAVRELVKKGITSVPDVVLGVRAYLKNLITQKGCADLLSKDVCDKIFKVTDALKVGRDVVKGLIHDVLVMGIPTPSKVIKLVMDKVRDHIRDRTCESYLAKEVCEKLRSIAKGLKTDVKLIEDFVKNAIISGLERRDEIFNAVVGYLRERVMSVKCDDLINPKICAMLRALAQNFKLKIETVDSAVKEAILLGQTTTQAIVNFSQDFLKNKVLNAKCDDFVPKIICDRLRSIAKRFKVSVDLVDQFVKDAIANGMETISEITGFVTDLIKESIKCENWLGEKSCGLIRRIATRVGVGMREVEQKLREIIGSGKSAVTDIFREIVDFIKGKILG